MVRDIRIYVEGGGDGNSNSRIRRGFSEFLSEIRDMARAKGVRCRPIPCGSRGSAFDDFKIALRLHPDAFNVLLVDAEDSVTESNAPWRHLERRDQWSRPTGTTDDHCHLMVPMMEAWLVADPECMQRYYGQGFVLGAVLRRPNVEEIGKQDLITALKAATRRTQKGEYHKIRHGPDLLALADAVRVRSVAPHCERLFAVLESTLREPLTRVGES